MTMDAGLNSSSRSTIVEPKLTAIGADPLRRERAVDIAFARSGDEWSSASVVPCAWNYPSACRVASSERALVAIGAPRHLGRDAAQPRTRPQGIAGAGSTDNCWRQAFDGPDRANRGAAQATATPHSFAGVLPGRVSQTASPVRLASANCAVARDEPSRVLSAEG